jgi:adenosine deaminase
MSNMTYVPSPLTSAQLHAHLTGSISRQTLHEIWLEKHSAGETILPDPLVAMPPSKHDYNLQTFFPLFSSYIYNLVDSSASLERATMAVLNDFRDDGVVYLELRTTPRKTGDLDSKEKYVQCVLNALRKFREGEGERGRDNGTGTDTGSGTGKCALHTYLILSIDRRNTPAEALETVRIAAKLRSQGIVGVDLCGDPQAKSGGQISVFTESIALAQAAGLRTTIHFAEAEISSSDTELQTILAWNPDRLGHVIHLNEDAKREVAKRRGIGLELCLSCNVHAEMVHGGFEAHHFGEWQDVEGPLITLGVSLIVA